MPFPNSTYVAMGTWTLEGDQLSCRILYTDSPQGYEVTQFTTAVVNLRKGELTSGTWMNDGPPGGTGKFRMKKTNDLTAEQPEKPVNQENGTTEFSPDHP